MEQLLTKPQLHLRLKPQLLERNVPINDLFAWHILTDCVSAEYRESAHYYTYYALNPFSYDACNAMRSVSRQYHAPWRFFIMQRGSTAQLTTGI